MAPKFAPKVWKRPYTSIYNNNYQYGNSLYSDQITDIERKYNEAMANTRLRHDRPDIGLSSFADSQLTGESVIAKHRTSAAHDDLRDERLKTISTSKVNNYYETQTDRKLAHSPSFDSYSSQRALDRLDREIEESRLRRSNSRRSLRRPESTIIAPTNPYENALLNNESGPGQSFWQERWYRNSLRSVAHDLYPTGLLRAMV